MTVKNVLLGLVIMSLVVGLALAMAESMRARREEIAKNPFTKIGALGTPNGVVAEVFKFERDCYVIVSTVPGEHGRAYMQMVCK